jgi:hypothetical protein
MVKDFKEDRNKQLNELRKAMWYMDEKFSTNIVSEKTTTTKKKKTQPNRNLESEKFNKSNKNSLEIIINRQNQAEDRISGLEQQG